jgi:translation initiation factor IF-1
MRNLAIALSVVLSFSGAQAIAAEPKTSDASPKGEISHTLEAEATVTAIDMNTRMVTLKAADGTENTLHVDERARNLGQVKVGDVVKVAYTEALAWKMSKSTKASPTAEVEEAAGRAKPGEKPGAAAARRITVTATIEAIDLDNGTVTLKGPQGNSRTIKARNPANLKKVKVGDLIDITYTEAVALKVEPAAKK